MCGICGEFRFGPDPVERGRVEQSCATMRHRGPDHSAVWNLCAEGISAGLGAVRLAVLDPTPACHQPMHDPSDRYHLVFNGEIYNYRTLRQELASTGVRFNTDGDTEVVLAACARWGVEALSRLSGMWALAFFDSTTGSGFLSRDPVGIKPLLYSADDGYLRFASELKALGKLDNRNPSINHEALIQHLLFGFIAQPDSIHAGARRLAPAHYLAFNSSGVAKPIPYYKLPVSNPSPDQSDYATACGKLRRTLSESVVSHRVSDVPIGAFLSGGLDSSIIVADLAQATGRRVKTFSVGYAANAGYDETRFARMVAKHFYTDHYELKLTDRDVLEAIPQVLDHLGEPVGDSSIIPTSLVSQFASRHVTVALSGDGGDELLGGYWRYLGHYALALYNALPGVIRHLVVEPLLQSASTSKSSGWSNRIRQLRKLLRARGDDPMARHVAWSRILAPEAEELFTEPRLAIDGLDRTLETARRLTADMNDRDWLTKILAFDVQYSLPSDMLQKVDLASMMHSLEVRVPFLDQTVVELALGLPSDFKIDRGRRKHILTEAYRGQLPEAILDRSKMGFEVPIGEYLRGPLRELFRDTVTRKAIESFDLLSFEGVEAIYQAHLNRRGEHADLLFALLSLCWWRRSQP